MITKYHNSYDFDTRGWDKIWTFNDALELNIEFLQGLRKSTPYHGAPVYDMDTSKLIDIHKYGRIFTDNGQSNECKYNVFIPETRHIYMHNDEVENERILKEMIYSTEQKSYMEGYIEPNTVMPLVSFLKKYGDRIAYRLYDISNKKFYSHNFKLTWTTREKASSEGFEGPWDECTRTFKAADIGLYEDHFTRIHGGLWWFFIYSVEPCDLNIEDILYEYTLQRLNEFGKRRKSRRTRKTKKSKKKSKKKSTRK
jgi:hypothetical protein